MENAKINLVVRWNGIVETKTFAKRTEEGNYKTNVEPNSLELHKTPLDKKSVIKVYIGTPEHEYNKGDSVQLTTIK